MEGGGFGCWDSDIISTTFVFSSNCGECFTSVCVVFFVCFLIQNFFGEGAGGFIFNSLQAVAIFLLFALNLLGLCLSGFL